MNNNFFSQCFTVFTQNFTKTLIIRKISHDKAFMSVSWAAIASAAFFIISTLILCLCAYCECLRARFLQACRCFFLDKKCRNEVSSQTLIVSYRQKYRNVQQQRFEIVGHRRTRCWLCLAKSVKKIPALKCNCFWNNLSAPYSHFLSFTPPPNPQTLNSPPMGPIINEKNGVDNFYYSLVTVV